MDRRSVAIDGYARSDRDDVLAAYDGRPTSALGRSVKALLAAQNADAKQVNTAVKDAVNVGQIAMEHASAGFDTGRANAVWFIVGVTIVAFAIVAAMLFIVATSIRRRLKSVTDAVRDMIDGDFANLGRVLQRVAEGDVTPRFTSNRTPLTIYGSDEIAALTRSYNSLVDRLRTIGDELTTGLARVRELISSVAQASRSMAIATDQTSASSNQAAGAVESIARIVDRVADGARGQAERIGTVSAAVEELARTASAIADGASMQSASMG